MSSLTAIDQESLLAAVREAVSDLIAVYQFGSTVRNRQHKESDLDLAILARRPCDNGDRWALQEELARQLHRDVDLVDLRAASTVMQMQVLSRGTVLTEWDRGARQRFEMNVYSAYALLNEERAAILDDIRARGRVYGR